MERKAKWIISLLGILVIVLLSFVALDTFDEKYVKRSDCQNAIQESVIGILKEAATNGITVDQVRYRLVRDE